jgi:hypothetical protein
MKEYEFRETKGFCRLCETATNAKAIVIPFRYGGKNAPIILCVECVKHLHNTVEPKPEAKPLYGSIDDWEPTMRFFRED